MKEQTTTETETSFENVTIEIMDVAKKYDELDPQITVLFLQMLETYVEIVKNLVEDPELKIDTTEAKTRLFNKVFDYDVKSEFTRMLQEHLESVSATDQNSDGDINKVDEDVLANIKKNIQSYLD